ncbi:MAG: SCO family protein [Saprospiraceae bacterium]|jgi:protein SCO1/2|nr:SCO family protein [Saprospiraceae bacterium]MBL0027410.1 SCO family protein [Saprospiraceae bacterium]
MFSLKYYGILLSLLIFLSCKQNSGELPYLGQTVVENGIAKHHSVGKINHYNQDSILITNDTLKKFIYVAEFFFTSCPSICPKVMKEMLKISEALKNDPQVKLVSFTIDPKRDTVNKLKLYADNLGIDHNKWYFLTGDKDETLELANTYFVAAFEDASSPGGFDHSGKILLVDKLGHIRSFSEGTDPESTPKFIKDIKILSETYTHAK